MRTTQLTALTSLDTDTSGDEFPNGTPANTPPAGYLARLGTWSASHLRVVLLAWSAVLALFGAFAPQVEHALAGAGWQDSTSQSVKARQIVQTEFRGLGATALQVVIVDERAPIPADGAARAVVAKASSLLGANPRVSVVVPPQPGVSLSPNGRTAVITAGSNGDPNAMVRAAEALAGPLHHLSRPGISVSVTGDDALWADFNAVNRSAMVRSEMLSWPVTLVILVLAFGSLVAAGLPLMLTLVGLMTDADPQHALVGAMHASGRVIVSAAAVVIAVFLTFALSGPLAPKEMGVILAVAIAFDALVVRLVVLPVILRLGGRHVWYRPPWLGRVLPQVRFSH